jgi:phosphohistidine phosphatase
MGRFMRNNRLSPDIVLSSTAKRASETVALLLKSAGFDVEVHFYDQLYMATPTVLMETVGKLHGDKNRVLLVGHNPGLEGFLYRLTGVRESMPTAALAHILLETDKWSEVSVRQNWRLETLVRPKDLKE